MYYDFTDYEKKMDIDTAAAFLDPNQRSVMWPREAHRYGSVGEAMYIAQAVASKYIKRMRVEYAHMEKEREILQKKVDQLERELARAREAPANKDGVGRIDYAETDT